MRRLVFADIVKHKKPLLMLLILWGLRKTKAQLMSSSLKFTLKFTNFLLEILSALIDKIKGMCTSLMSLFGSIIDQYQEYYSFNDVLLIIL